MKHENRIESTASIGFKLSRMFVKTSLVLTHSGILVRKGHIVELNERPQVPNLVSFLESANIITIFSRLMFSTVHHSIDLFHLPTLMQNSLYSLIMCMLHYNTRHVSSINMPIFRRTNCIITASDIVTLSKLLYSTPDESRLFCSLLSSGIPYCNVQRVRIPDAVIIQFVLLKKGMLMLETCRIV